MKLYTVHIKPGEPGAQTKPIFVREGFNLPAFALTILWALYERLWAWALLLVAANIALVLLDKHLALSIAVKTVLQLAMNLLVGLHANDWLRTRLHKQGYITADVCAADSKLRAEQRYFERVLAAA